MYCATRENVDDRVEQAIEHSLKTEGRHPFQAAKGLTTPLICLFRSGF